MADSHPTMATESDHHPTTADPDSTTDDSLINNGITLYYA